MRAGVSILKNKSATRLLTRDEHFVFERVCQYEREPIMNRRGSGMSTVCLTVSEVLVFEKVSVTVVVRRP